MAVLLASFAGVKQQGSHALSNANAARISSIRAAFLPCDLTAWKSKPGRPATGFSLALPCEECWLRAEYKKRCTRAPTIDLHKLDGPPEICHARSVRKHAVRVSADIVIGFCWLQRCARGAYAGML